MIPQNQTEFGPGKGNCWAACIASILGVPLETVPNFCGGASKEHWWSETQHWLSCCGLTMLEMDVSRRPQDFSTLFDCYWIANGKSPRFDCLHSVVYCGDKMVHDPHPDGTGLKGPVQSASFMVSIDPAKFLKKVQEYVPLLEQDIENE